MSSNHKTLRPTWSSMSAGKRSQAGTEYSVSPLGARRHRSSVTWVCFEKQPLHGSTDPDAAEHCTWCFRGLEEDVNALSDDMCSTELDSGCIGLCPDVDSEMRKGRVMSVSWFSVAPHRRRAGTTYAVSAIVSGGSALP